MAEMVQNFSSYPNNVNIPLLGGFDYTKTPDLFAGDMRGLACLMGSSSASRGLVQTAGNYSAPSENWFNWMNWFLGCPLNINLSVAVAGTTISHLIDTQLPQILALKPRPKYALIAALSNDIHSNVSASVLYPQFTSLLETLLNHGIVPVWSTVCPRYSVSASMTIELLLLNHMLRDYANNNNVGLFFDVAAYAIDYSNGNNQIVPGYKQSDNVHVNNLGAYVIGLQAATAFANKVTTAPKYSSWNSSWSTLTNEYINVLRNGGFVSQTGGTGGTGITGNVPLNYTASWPTRTGTGSVAFSYVTLSDTNGISRGTGCVLTFTGTASDGDIFRLALTAMPSRPSVSKSIVAECWIKGATLANIGYIGIKATSVTGDIISAGYPAYLSESVALPATLPEILIRTPIIKTGDTSIGNSEFDIDIGFKGAGTNSVITLWMPNMRSLS